MNYKTKLKQVKAFVFDCDGVLTDGSVTLMPNGEQVRKMSTRDGYALQLAVKKCYVVAVITGGRSAAVKSRMNRLGIHDVYLACNDKVDALNELMSIYDLDAESILYMGDDMPDFEVMQKVGLPTCPDNAAQEIKNLSDYISHKKGGEGCVRDVIEQTMKIQGKWTNDTSTTSI
ncbi:MAG: HAD-IIIA family hydrolase [Flavobacteriales bacterium]|nr:HAD-IIIA family hydrolase [Flavobacteriales bacterium]